MNIRTTDELSRLIKFIVLIDNTNNKLNIPSNKKIAYAPYTNEVIAFVVSKNIVKILSYCGSCHINICPEEKPIEVMFPTRYEINQICEIYNNFGFDWDENAPKYEEGYYKLFYKKKRSKSNSC
jgi:hypothetical protein